MNPPFEQVASLPARVATAQIVKRSARIELASTPEPVQIGEKSAVKEKETAQLQCAGRQNQQVL